MRISDWSSDVCSSDLPEQWKATECHPDAHYRDRPRNELRRHQSAPISLKIHDRSGRSPPVRSEEHTSELQSLMRISYAVFCLKKKKLSYIKIKKYNHIIDY